MGKFAIVGLLSAWLVSGAVWGKTGVPTDPAIEAVMRRYVGEEQFRGVVLVAQDGKLLHKAAYGPADEKTGRGNRVDTPFLIGSLTKSFTAVTVMQLVEEGLLDLNAPLSRYLPGLKQELGNKLTLHFLLKQQSGLPVHLERLVELEEREIPSSEILAIINRASLSFEPGSRHEYSNLNFHLAALVIEAVSGKSYAEVLAEKTFAPLAMANSGVERFSAVPASRARGYRKGMLGLDNDENNVSYALGSGDIYTSVDDLHAWDQALFSKRLVSDKSRARLFDGGSEEWGYYGYGFRIQPYTRGANASAPGTLVRHGGSMDGFLSNYHHYIDDKLTVIVLGNIRPFSIRDLSYELKVAALGGKPGPRNGKGE